MGVNLKFGTAGATGGGWSAQPGTLQPAFDEGGLLVRPDFSWQRRSPKTWRDRNAWVSLWPTSRFAGGAGGTGTDAMVVVGQGLDASGMYEPFSCDGEGTQTLKFIKGAVVTASDVAVSGANVTAFRTTDNAHAGYVVQSREDGSYDVPTNFPGVAHYVTAYKAGAPDVGGTTVNTLTPANVDGT